MPTTDKELLAAAERQRAGQAAYRTGRYMSVDDWARWHSDQQLIVDAYLADHGPDGEPQDRGSLSIGQCVWLHWTPELAWVEDTAREEQIDLIATPTTGQLTRLLAALKGTD